MNPAQESQQKNLHHSPELQTTIILVNLGTPAKPTYYSTMTFLREFLSDTRVIKITKWLWYPILCGFILPFRSQGSKKKYALIHTPAGMPLMQLSKALHKAVKVQIEKKHPKTKVLLAMRYGQHQIQDVLATIKKVPHKKLMILPLFPQYSATTTASIFDAVSESLKKWDFLPNYQFIRDYCNRNDYISALVKSIEVHWSIHGKSELLLFSYHGLPKSSLDSGDPYYCYCQKTSRLVAQQLSLSENKHKTVFQSRFGPSQWLKPYAEETLIQLAKSGIQEIDIIAPSFSVDCLETLDEIKREYQEVFEEHGGKKIKYIPALNDSRDAIKLISNIIEEHL